MDYGYDSYGGGGNLSAGGGDYYNSNASQMGGGFVESGSQFSQGGTPAKKSGRSRESQSLLPVTVKMLKTVQHNELDDVFRIDNQEISNLKMVGMILNVNHQSTYITFELNDGSGAIEGRLFVHGDENEFQQEQIKQLRDGTYVRAIGTLRSFKDQVNLSCFNVVPVEDMNELTHHFCSVIHSHLFNTKGRLQANQSGLHTPMKGSGNNNSFGTPTQQFSGMGMINSNFDYSSNSSVVNVGTPANMVMGSDTAFPMEQRILLEVLGTATTDTGLSMGEIFQKVQGRLSEQQIRDSLTYLTNEGHVYSTVDEDHFKRTE